jgi:hypothetical protein
VTASNGGLFEALCEVSSKQSCVTHSRSVWVMRSVLQDREIEAELAALRTPTRWSPGSLRVG